MLNLRKIKSNYIELTRQIKDFLLTRQSREFFVFLVFFCIAGAYWVLQTLNNDFETEITFPVRLKGMPENVVVTSEPPSELRVLVKDRGTVLLNYSLSKNFYPITIDFADYKYVADHHIRLCGSDLFQKIQEQFNASTQLLSVTPDTIDVYFSTGEAKRVPVRLQGSVNAASQYYLSDTLFSPDSVLVYAPSGILDTVEAVYTQPLNEENIADTFIRKLPVVKRRGMKCVPDEVELTLPIDMFTEKSVEVPLEGIGFPSGKVLRTFPSKVKISFQIGLGRFRQVNADDFHLFVSYDELLELGAEKCTVRLDHIPEGVLNVRVEPDQVDFLIEQLD